MGLQIACTALQKAVFAIVVCIKVKLQPRNLAFRGIEKAKGFVAVFLVKFLGVEKFYQSIQWVPLSDSVEVTHVITLTGITDVEDDAVRANTGFFELLRRQ